MNITNTAISFPARAAISIEVLYSDFADLGVDDVYTLPIPGAIGVCTQLRYSNTEFETATPPDPIVVTLVPKLIGGGAGLNWFSYPGLGYNRPDLLIEQVTPLFVPDGPLTSAGEGATLIITPPAGFALQDLTSGRILIDFYVS